MKIKMLESLAGIGFALSIGEETDRFDDVEAGRLIDAGFAEKAPASTKKPATKAEWEDERTKLLADRASEQAEYAAFKEREAAMQAQIDALTSFKDSVAASLGLPSPAAELETTDKPAAPEQA